MRFYFRLLITLTGFFGALVTNAQNSSSRVNLQQPDKPRLEWLTYEAVNKLREQKKLPDLVWDDVLYRAAIDHAQYLLGEKKISHYQTIKGKKTPAERVKIHGGLVYTAIGENIVEITLGCISSSKGVPLSTVTYEAAASTMAWLWKNSPGHYKNIISKNYNCTALAVAYDNKLQRLIAVQVFGYSSTPATPEKLPDYSSHLLKQPTPKLPYGLKKYTAKKQKATDGFLQMGIDRGYITGKYKDAKKIFRGRRSGIVQEFIPLSQFDSASTEFSMVPNRRNALFELNGKLSTPIYRRQLLKYSRKHTPPSYYINTKFIRCFRKPPTYFLYPLQPNESEIAFNLFLVKNNHLQVYKSYIVIPGRLLETPYPTVTYLKPFKEQAVPDKYRTYNTYDTLHVKIYYASGQAIPDSAKQIQIAKNFKSIKGKITSVQIAAFASVEGEKISNDLLAKARMDNFMLLVKPYLDTITINPKLIKQEQWKLFYKQLDGTQLQFLKKMKPDEIRAYVN
ncbi:MAG TPA: CAP domain-containing protein, partial [Cytophaga sp.]|nr:CAP domain-containing protein [Cytophaga sp.]